MTEIEKYKEEFKAIELRYNFLKYRIADIERDCNHNWGKTKNEIETTGGGYDPGDPPGTMGVDRRTPTSYPIERTTWFVRTCTVCGKTEKSKGIEKPVIKAPWE